METTVTPGALASPADVAKYLGISVAALAQQRFKGTGPRFVKINGRSVRYRWSDVVAWLDGQTFERTDNQRAAGAR